MNQLLIIAENADDYARHLQAAQLPDLEIRVAESAAAAAEQIGSANIVLGVPAMVAPILQQASQLQWLQSAFAGIEPFCAPNLRTDYTLTGVKDIFGPLMSEYVFTYILANERQLLATRDNQRQHHWQRLPYRSLADVAMGICGLGSIGQAIARTAGHFQMQVLGLSRSATPVPGVKTVYPPQAITELARQVDYLVTVLPNTAETQGLINANVLQALGPTGTLINVGRGAAVNEQALIDALEQNKIAGAILDVFATEPLPTDSPLWGFDNVIITPHNSAVTFPKDIAGIFCDNYRRFTAGEPLNYVIDFQRGY